MGNAKSADRQRGIIVARRTCPNKHRIMAGAQGMHMAPCLWASDPLAIAAGCCNAPIQACGQFQSHGRTPVLQPRQKACVIPGRLRAAHIFGDCDASCTQHGKATTIDARIRITKGTNNAADTGLDEGFCARGRLARMCAGLQCHINRGASRRVPCLGQSLRLCMRTAPGRCPSAPNNPSALHDHAAHSRVGPDVPLPAPAERQRKLHVAFVYIRRRKRRRHPSWVHSSEGDGGRSSLTKLSKSSMAWKFL